MHRLVLAVLAVAVVLSGVALYAQSNMDVEKALQAKEQAGWQGWKDHDVKPIADMVPNDSINIADGMVTKGKQQILNAMSGQNCKVNSFSLSDFAYMWLDKDTVLMTYSAMQDATCDGKKQTPKVIASSIWQKKGGKWVSPFHQETPAGAM